MKRRFTLSGEGIRQVDVIADVFRDTRKFFKSTKKLRITVDILKDPREAGITPFGEGIIQNTDAQHSFTLSKKLVNKGISATRSSRLPAMRVFMKSIQNSSRDPYHVVSDNLAKESQKSMDKLRSLIGGSGESGGKNPFSRRRP
jgi:hypothetical protein